jgi:hypothetical protein
MAFSKTEQTRRLWIIAAVLGVVTLPGSPATGRQSLDQILNKGVVVPGKNPPAKRASPQQPAKPAANPAAPATAVSTAFRMDLLPGWHAQLAPNGAVLAAGQDGSAVVIAPIVGAGSSAAGNWLQQRGASTVAQYLKNPAITGIYSSRMGAGAALASFDYSSPAGPGTANVLCLVGGGVGTLYVIAGPKAVFPQQRSGLVRILQSFTFTGEGPSGGESAQAARTSFTRFKDPNEGAFTVDVPAGWKVEGGMVRKASTDTRPYVWATSPDGSTVIRLRDPAFGSFRTPGQIDARQGRFEGMPYSPGYGVVMVLSHYMPGPEFAQQYAVKLARDLQASNLQFKGVKPRQDLSSSNAAGYVQEQITGGEAEFTCARNGQPCGGKVIASTRVHVLPAMPDSATWYIDLLASYITPQERLGATDQIFQHMIESVQYSPEWAATQLQITGNTSQIVRDTTEYGARVFDEVHRNREQAEERIQQNRIDTIRGRVRLRDPDTGEELEGVAGRNYYYRVPGGRTVGTDTVIRAPDFTELQQIR